MSASPNDPPFQREANVDQPGLIGAKWWHASLVDEETRIARRKAIKNILIGGAVIAGFGAMLTFCIRKKAPAASTSTVTATTSDPSVPPVEASEGRSTAINLQKEYGWSFGANGEAIVFDGTQELPFDPKAQADLGTVMSPGELPLRVYYQPTLFVAPVTNPTKLAQLDAETVSAYKPLYPELKPFVTTAMKKAYARGKSMASLFAALPSTPKVALVVDLPGPEAVAFAAGAARMFVPVCLFDNWPHPRGVVQAHQTLAAALYYEPLFAKEKDDKTRRTTRMPMFVLDRRRITPYTDEATQFDNRYIAKLPWPGTAMKALGGEHVLYIVPEATDAAREVDDLNDDFVSYVKDGVTVKIVPLDHFLEDASVADAGASDAGADAGKAVAPKMDAVATLIAESGNVYWGGSPKTHFTFFDSYPVAKNPRLKDSSQVDIAFPPPGASYDPSPRKSSYSSGMVGGSSVKPAPTNFSTVPVLLAVGTGALIGYRYSQLGRSGSWNRYGGSGYSG